MAKLVVLVPALGMGGAERSAVKFCNSLADLGHQVQMLCIGQHKAAMRDELSAKVCFTALSAPRTASPGTVLRIVGQLRQVAPDAVMGWSMYANFVAVVAARLAGVPRVLVSERNYPPNALRNAANGPIRRWLLPRLMACLYGRADVVTANSQRALKATRRMIGPSRARFTLLPNLAEVDRYASLANAPLAPVELGRAGTPHLLAIGRLHHQKGFDVLIRAMAHLSKVTDWHLHLAGDGSERQTLQALAERLDIAHRVHFLGSISNPFPLYRWADLVIVPSRWEGFPNVPLEAMAMGRAVIVSDCHSGPAELTERGRFAELVEVEDVVQLSQAIGRLGHDTAARQRLGEQAAAHVRANYSSEVVQPQYQRAIELLCAR